MFMRFATAGVAALSVLMAAPAAADVSDYLGRPIESVRIESAGRPAADPRLLQLVETHVGDRLLSAAVRESIVHLFSLGEFDDVRVRATAAGPSVSLTYELMPMRTIGSIAFRGDGSRVDRGRLRRLVDERFGPSPRPSQVVEIAKLVEDDLRATGFLRARVVPNLQPTAGAATSILALEVVAGERTRIGRVDVEGDPGMPIQDLLRALQLSPGAFFSPENLSSRIGRYVEQRRSRGFLASRVSYATQFTDDDRTVDVSLAVIAGPHVNVLFNGDPIPSDRHDDLVPIAREGSADEDLLEDSSNRIQDFLRSQGFRDAVAPHTRVERGSELDITFTISKGPQYRVGRIDFSGNTSITLPDLQQSIRIRPGQPFSDAAIAADRAIVEDLYRRSGFANVQTQVTTESEPPVPGAVDAPVAIRFAITENTRTRVASVRIEGAQTLTEDALLASLSLQPQQPFSLATLAADRDAIQLQLANRGFPSATVTTSPGLSADGARADVVFTVRQGQQIVVDHVLVVGNSRTRTETIERELQFKPGDPLGLDKVNETQRRLTALGLFRRVRITELAHGDEARRDVLINIDEAPVTTVGYGGGVEAGQLLRTDEETGIATATLEFAPRAFFEVGRRNFFGKNRSINLFTRVSLGTLQSQTTTRTALGFGEYRAIATYREPRVFRTNADAFLTGTFEQQKRSSFNFVRQAFNAEMGRRLTRLVSVSGSYQLQRTELFDEQIDPEFRIPIDRLFPELRLSSFSTSIVRDTRDDVTDPLQGRFLSANGQAAGQRIGSQVGFSKAYFVGQMFRIVPHAKGAVLAASGRLGIARAFPRETDDKDGNGNPILGPDGRPQRVIVRDLPESERFFAGGDTTVRGFALDQLGTPPTIDKDGFPTGGAGLVILNAEIRVPMPHGFGAVGFVDAGNVFARTSDIRLTELRGAVGFGVRYKSPIGPIRVDLGFKLHRNVIRGDERESLTALHISLGQAF